MQLIANLTMTAHEFLFMKLFGIVVLYLLDQTGKNCCPQGQNGGLISSLPECITPLDYFLSHIPKPDLVLLSATKFVQIPLRHYASAREIGRAPHDFLSSGRASSLLASSLGASLRCSSCQKPRWPALRLGNKQCRVLSLSLSYPSSPTFTFDRTLTTLFVGTTQRDNLGSCFDSVNSLWPTNLVAKRAMDTTLRE